MLFHTLAPQGAPDPEELLKFFVEKKSMNYVVVQNDIIVNIITWDGETPYTPPEDCKVYEFEGQANIGWAWIDGEPIDPNPPIQTNQSDIEHTETETNTGPTIL